MVQFTDTPCSMPEQLTKLLRSLSSAREIELVTDPSHAARGLALAGLRHRYPKDSPAKPQRRLTSNHHGPELTDHLFGPILPDA